MKRWLSLVAATVAVCFALSGTLEAQKGGGAHGAGGSGSSKSVHVKTYTKKDGTHVAAHDRKSPDSAGDERPSLADVARATAARRAESTPRPASLADLSRSERARHPVATNGTPQASTWQIYTVVDPITGRTTLTNVMPGAARTTAPAGSFELAAPPAAPRAAKPTPATGRRSVVRGITRSADGRIARSAAARHAFARQTGYPSGRPGYVIDHIKPLACGGADAPANMQWETIAEGKAKDKWERVGCR